ncbi:MAG: hypothetical protein GY726_13495 [Proteobacteria bacterium]|nr:hypothetical protein [Pseudomonadota bacterium]MCP4935934.1 hypothetical protein [bacterium]
MLKITLKSKRFQFAISEGMTAILIIYGVILLLCAILQVWRIMAMYLMYLVIAFPYAHLEMKCRERKEQEQQKQERRRRGDNWQEKHKKIYRLKRLDNQSFSGMDTEEE